MFRRLALINPHELAIRVEIAWFHECGNFRKQGASLFSGLTLSLRSGAGELFLLGDYLVCRYLTSLTLQEVLLAKNDGCKKPAASCMASLIELRPA
jgi:hypothetical protein